MATPIRRPCFVAGTPRHSGGVQTGEVNTTNGGDRTYTSFSGIVADVLVTTGAGRLNTITVTANITSGRPVVFYDSAVATSGGPFSTSGHKILGVIGPVWHPGASGLINQNSQPGVTLTPQTAFQSGLCIGTALGSGTPSFTIGYTPEVTE